ncbi:MAG: hypothetical protein IKV60_00940, partial [Rikenellaceae bacterium]|nr:hypothetical protein [Rikenellaceae bacterium]
IQRGFSLLFFYITYLYISRITSADSRLASSKKRSLLVVNEHFESERNAEAALLDGLQPLPYSKK